jgi:LuxR family maltose regulon positive regulatory protein
MASLGRGGYRSDVVGGAVTVADIRVAQGRLREAMAAYEQGLRVAEQSQPVLRGAADMHVGIADLLRERHDLQGAHRHLLAGTELGEHAGLPKNRHRRLVATARLRQAEGDIGAALDLLDEAEHLYVGDFSPEVRPIAALRARVGLARGGVDDALTWARGRRLSVDDDLSYLREYEHVTFARALVARYTKDHAEVAVHGATGLLGRLLRAAEDGARTGSVIEILIVQALADHARGDLDGALARLRRAVALAEPEGYVRTFADEGPAMSALLDAAVKGSSTEPGARAYVRRLRAAAAGTGDPAPAPRDLLEPLSPRERDVLRLLATDLDGPDIARELVVSLSTVRTHTRNLYAKLGVSSRRAAVHRADDLGLLSRPRRG